eukprot:71669-Chlamydomonas_euryale.AAC.1
MPLPWLVGWLVQGKGGSTWVSLSEARVLVFLEVRVHMGTYTCWAGLGGWPGGGGFWAGPSPSIAS